MDQQVAELLGPGTRVEVRWPKERKGHAWWTGKVVANESGEIAVRYPAQLGLPEAITWHDNIHTVGCRILEVVRMEEGVLVSDISCTRIWDLAWYPVPMLCASPQLLT